MSRRLKIPSRLQALSMLIFFYIMVPIIGILIFVVTIGTHISLMVIPLIMYLCLSAYIWSMKVDYGSKTLNTIKIDEAPPNISNLLSETTSRGILINQLILKTIAENRGISQTEVHKELPISEDNRPTKETVRLYAVKLKESGLIRDMTPALGEGKKCVYVLTKHGEWCLPAIKKYYPKYYVFFLVRVVMRTHWRKRLPSFEDIKE